MWLSVILCSAEICFSVMRADDGRAILHREQKNAFWTAIGWFYPKAAEVSRSSAWACHAVAQQDPVLVQRCEGIVSEQLLKRKTFDVHIERNQGRPAGNKAVVQLNATGQTSGGAVRGLVYC
jgi:hypothetical protein